MLKIQQRVKTKVSNANLLITENQIKDCLGKKKKEKGDDAKMTKD